MPPSDRETSTHALGAIRLLGSVGLVAAGGIVAGVVLGGWAGRWLDSGWPVAVGIVAGIAAGGGGAVALLLRELPWKR